jgi:hypothetical protein
VSAVHREPIHDADAMEDLMCSFCDKRLDLTAAGGRR